MTRPNGHSDNGNAGAIQEPAGNEALNDVLLPPRLRPSHCRRSRQEQNREPSSRSNRTGS